MQREGAAFQARFDPSAMLPGQAIRSGHGDYRLVTFGGCRTVAAHIAHLAHLAGFQGYPPS
jgi:hypothetical protein